VLPTIPTRRRPSSDQEIIAGYGSELRRRSRVCSQVDAPDKGAYPGTSGPPSLLVSLALPRADGEVLGDVDAEPHPPVGRRPSPGSSTGCWSIPVRLPSRSRLPGGCSAGTPRSSPRSPRPDLEEAHALPLGPYRPYRLASPSDYVQAMQRGAGENRR